MAKFRTLLVLISGLVASLALAAPASAAPGAIKWRFEVAGQYILQPPAVAPDGSVAVVGSSGRLYSLTADGALRWSVPGVGGDGGPSIGPDGTVYVGSGDRITAVAPDGTIRWTFVEPTNGQGVIAGPTVGPDGNIYVVADLGGLGAYALSPAGDLLWNNPGDPNLQRVRTARRGDRLRLREALRLVRRVPGRAERDDVRAHARRDAGLGGRRARRERHLHAAPGAACRRPGWKPLSDRLEQPVRLVARALRPEHGLGRLELHPVARERHVAAVGRAGRVDLPRAQPQLPGCGHPERRQPLDVLRRLDHRPAASDAGRERRRRRRSPELR